MLPAAQGVTITILPLVLYLIAISSSLLIQHTSFHHQWHAISCCRHSYLE